MGVFPDTPLGVLGNQDRKAEAQPRLQPQLRNTKHSGPQRGSGGLSSPDSPLDLSCRAQAGRTDEMNSEMSSEVPAGSREGWPAGVGQRDPASAL